MTVIAAYIDHEGVVAIGSDSRASSGYIHKDNRPKLYRFGQCVVGTSGSAALFNLLAERGVADCAPSDEPLPWVLNLRNMWLDECRKNGHGFVESGMWAVPGSLLIATPTTIFEITGDGEIVEHLDYMARGSGCDVAMGTLWLLKQRSNVEPLAAKLAVAFTIAAAVDHSPGCGGKTVVMLPSEGLVHEN